MDGNAAVISSFLRHKELQPIVDRYIRGSQKIDWNDQLKAAGIVAIERDQVTKLQVTAKQAGRQRDLLDKLGYNNWRKLSSKQ
jgi:hypothetical protein